MKFVVGCGVDDVSAQSAPDEVFVVVVAAAEARAAVVLVDDEAAAAAAVVAVGLVQNKNPLRSCKWLMLLRALSMERQRPYKGLSSAQPAVVVDTVRNFDRKPFVVEYYTQFGSAT